MATSDLPLSGSGEVACKYGVVDAEHMRVRDPKRGGDVLRLAQRYVALDERVGRVERRR